MTSKEKWKFLENRRQSYAALGVGFVCLIVGLPLWWKTTEVYRVQLPYADIEQLSKTKIHYTTRVYAIPLSDALSLTELNVLSKLLVKVLNSDDGSYSVSKYDVTVRPPLDDENDAFKQAASIADLDARLGSILPAEENQVYVFILPTTSGLDVSQPYIGAYRNAFITHPGDMKKLNADISTMVIEVFVREGSLLKKLQAIQGARDLKPDKESMRSVKASTGYDITFTLINPQPDILNVQWDIEHGVVSYLDPLLEKLKNYTDITVQSQVLYYTGLVIKPRKDETSFYYELDDLPHLINPLESKLGSHVSNNPNLEFVVYIPTRDQSPLHIHDSAGASVSTNSFLSPRWGGIHIYNVPAVPASSHLPHRVDIDIKRVMEIFISQLRMLLGLQSQVTGFPVKMASLGNKAISQWELDSWLRTHCIENLATSAATLRSLSQLLGEIGNIVINDDIGNEVEKAVVNIKQSQRLLTQGELYEAFHFSREAIIASEKAFFDPSLLELLYFPEDQKFAIYIPLFLPISIPVILASVQAIKWIKAQRKQNTEQFKKEE